MPEIKKHKSKRYDYTKLPRCPHCGMVLDDEIEVDAGINKCCWCERKFLAEYCTLLGFSTKPVSCTSQKKAHIWKKGDINTSKKDFFRMDTCSKCFDHRFIDVEADGIEIPDPPPPIPEIRQYTPKKKEVTVRITNNHIGIWTNEPKGNFYFWENIRRYLKRRGAILTQDKEIVKDYGCLSGTHKAGYIPTYGGRVLFKDECHPANIMFNFWYDGKSIKNRIFPCSENYNSAPYLVKKKIRWFQNSILAYLKKKHIVTKITDFTQEENLGPAEAIMHRYSVSSRCPVRGGKPLNELDDHLPSDLYGTMLSYCKDKNGKEIRMGDQKYFRDYSGRIAKGFAYHNINNMWWIISGARRRNLACFDLFDFESGMPRKLHENSEGESHIIRIQKAIDVATKKKDWLKCHSIQTYLDRIIK